MVLYYVMVLSLYRYYQLGWILSVVLTVHMGVKPKHSCQSTGDLGLESEEMYDSDMAVYMQSLQRRDPEQLKILEKNISTI